MRHNSLPFHKVIERTISYGYKKLKAYFFIYILLSLMLSCVNFVSIYILQKMFDVISNAVTGGHWTQSTFNLVILTGAVLVVSNILKGIHGYFSENYFMQFMSKILKDMNAKAGKLDLVDYESLELYQKINMAIGGVNYAIKSTISLLNGVIFHVSFFISVTIYFFSIKPTLVLLCFLIFIPKFVSQMIRGSKIYQIQEKLADKKREFDYFQKCLVDKEYFKETKTYRGTPYFIRRYNEALQSYNSQQWNTERKIAYIDLFLSCFTYLGYVGSFLLLVKYLMDGTISIGIFTAIYYSLNKLMSSMKDMVELFGSIYQNSSLAGKLYDFLDLPERSGRDHTFSSVEKVTLNNISFSYPYANKCSLDRVSLEIEKGTKLAIVGVNGAGKSTLVKLLSGLLQPNEGSVLLNDIDIGDISPKSTFSRTSAVFQNFGRYKLTLKENVILSDIEKEAKEEEIISKMETSGFDYSKIEQLDSLETMMSREFGGIDLSGGQWQRLAIARGFYRSNDMIILDEPTSAIDPIEEAHLYDRFIQMSEGKIAIIVTHRLGSVKLADRIIVMETGRIIEDGTHEELMKKDGVYASMFLSQAEWYSR
ncbi:ABC transporter ATP-binding protein [Gorillibacterium timonense]|uniref:ABC transporter ATP-binding protein n=1 Tax=Gorillibacterium timonense TaxID=1689269 RepID=UPI00071D0082|nr:ABC transporter ATP-binding protein [Gorillibacterium timonense]